MMKKTKASKPKTSKPESETDLADKSDAENFLIVGIGASAGGVSALKTFFENVPADSGSAYVVILHLSPNHDSQLAEVLQTVALIPVKQVKKKVRVEPNHVYVVPPNQSLSMADGHIVVSPIHTVEERRAPVDIFFRTLAESHGERAVAVILSGTGANGSMGIKRVKEKGGAAFVQNPREAEFSEMPRNSIATDLIDLILNVSEIPAQIVAYRNNPGKIEIPAEPEKQPKEKPRLQPQEQVLVNIFTQLRVRTGHDFANYKRATMLRRIERRINVRGLPDITAYAAYLRENPDETHALLKDLLISVTNFFRDKETFTYLESEILPKLFDGKNSDEQVRVWVAGCATGEEAYSLAMFLAEQAAKTENAPAIQIFATDIDEAAVAKAREGFYTLNDAADVSPERLKRFFTKETDGFRIRRELRELILFAHHNVIKDPPFSRLDLVTCRNMLIYLNQQAQERVMETFHFSLNAGGYLFLGNSETVDGAGNLYATVSREHHIYQSRQAVPRIGYPVPDASMQAIRFVEPVESGEAPENGHQQNARPLKRMSFGDLHQQLLEEYTPSVVVSEEHDIVHMSESSLKFLKMSAGEPTQNLLKLIRPELRIELRTALYQAAQRQKNVEVPNVEIKIDGQEESVNICVRPVLRQGDAGRGFILVLFDSVKRSHGKAEKSETIYSSDEPVARQLEEELIRSKEQLRSSAEQYEVQAEELKASNEELQAMNEELRSSAEELETGKEELQSLNEELGTVNQELKIKIEEISQTSNNLNNLINSTDIGTIFLDRLFRVDLFTPAAADIFSLIPADIGRPLTDIAHQLEKTDLLADAKLVLKTLQAVEREVRSVEGRDFMVRVLPYRTKDDKIGGVVLTFYDVTARKRAEEAVRESEERLQRAINIETVGVIFFNNEIEITDCNDAFLRMTGFTAEEIRAGRFSWELFTPEEFIEPSRRAIEELNAQGFTTPYEKEYIRKDGTRFWALFSCRRISQNESVEFVSDITEQKRAEEKIRRSEAGQAYLLKLADALRPLADAEEIRLVSATVLGRHLRANRVAYAENVSDERCYEVPRNYVDGAVEVTGRFRYADYGSDILEQLESGQIRVQPDVQNDSRLSVAEKRALAKAGVGASLNVPLVKNERLVAFLGVNYPTAHDFQPDEIELVKETAERTWAAVERARAEEALAASEEKYHTLFDSIDEGFVEMEMVMDDAGRIVDWRWTAFNPAFERMSGLKGIKGQLFSEIVPKLEPEWAERYGHVVATGEALRFELPVGDLDSWFDIFVSRIGGEKSRRIAVVFNDITERKRREANLAFLADTSADFAPLLSAEELMERVGKRLGDFLNLSRCNFSVVDVEADRIECVYDWRREDSLHSMIGAHRVSDFLSEDGRRHYAAGKISVINDTRNSSMPSASFETLDALGIRSVVDAPSLNDGRWEFLLTVARSEAGEWREDEVVLVREIAERIYIRVERARAEAALRESEERFRAMFEQANVGIVQASVEGELLAPNPGFCKIIGYSEEEARRLNLRDITHPEDYEREVKLTGQLIAGEIPGYSIEKRYVCKDGSIVWGNMTATLIRHAEGEPLYALAIVEDISERKRAEQALRESEERLRLATEAAEMYSWEFDAGSKTYKFSENAAQILGIDADDLPVAIEDTFRRVHPDDLKTMRATLKDALRTGEGFTLDLRSVKKSGEIVWLSVQTTVVKDDRGRAARILGITQDITTRRRAEEALAESETRLRMIVENAKDYAILAMTRDNLIDSWSAGAEKIFGWTETEAIGRSAEIIFTPEDCEKGVPEQEIETALRMGRAPDERFHIRKDGSRFYASGVLTLLQDANGDAQGFVKIARDMTESIEAEKARRDKELLQKLVSAQETERKRIARDLHDELGQQLTALRLKLDAAKKLCEGDELCGKVDEIELLAKSIDHGVDFLAWELRPAALDDLGLVAALDNYVNQWSHHSGVTAELLASSLKRIRFAPEIETNLYRIVQEALNNTHKHAKAKSVEVVLERRDNLIVLLVEDNGIGFNPKDKKNPLKGIGLIGMKERAQLIGGTMEIESTPKKGTTVYVRVPAAAVKRKKADEK